MKLAILTAALATGLIAAAPAPAHAAKLSAGISASDGHVAGHLKLADYDRGHRGRHRGGYCQNWRRARHRLERRFDYVRLQRKVYNRRGDKVFIARAENRRGRPVRVRYNACSRQVTRVKALGRGYGRGARCEGWRYVHRKLHRRYDDVRLHRKTRNRRGHKIFIAHTRNYRGRSFRVRYNACLGRVMRVVPLGRY